MEQKTLRDWLPKEFFIEYMDTRAAKFLDINILEEYESMPHPFKYKNIVKWCVLENEYAVGWNENFERGWSFPVVQYKKGTNNAL